MRTRFAAIIGLLLLLVTGIALHVNNTAPSYDKFSVDLDTGEEVIYAECKCIGMLSVAESYPPQYSCSGVELCQDVNYTK